MKFFVKSTPAQKPKTPDSQMAAYLFAGILVIFAVAQLFSFDEFLPLFGTFNMPGGEFVGRLAGSILVICEVFALPFLLGMRLSPLARKISMVMGWVVSAGWLKIALWLNLTTNSVTNIGILGTKVEFVPGWWAVSFMLALCLLAVWATWGLWPGNRQG